MRVLAVEDDPVSRRILVAVLEQLGHSVIQTVDGEAAWEQFQLEPVEAVITDWMMPRVDGIELTRRIRAEPRERYTYILMLTALNGRDRYLDGMKAGADDFLTKPLDREELYARLRVAGRILGLQTAVQRLEGLLPICSYCKKIRDEEQQWRQVEEYVSKKTEATFSHGICPDCYERHLRPQLDRVALGHAPEALP
jgi:phosphoserine phosphatase RsbU/P